MARKNIKMGNTYKITGTPFTITRLAWCFLICRDGAKVTTYSTRKGALAWVGRNS